MKKIILLILLSMAVLALFANNYAIENKTDKDKNFILSTIKKGNHVVARFCLVDPDPFYLYSIESDEDLFPNIEKNLSILAARKGRGNPEAMILVDFRNQEKIRRPLNIKYLVNYLFLISFSPPYLRKVEILNPSKSSKMFFVETKINGKAYYGALDLPRSYEANEAKKFIQSIKGAGEISLIVPVLDNVPVKLVVMQNGTPITLYESFPGHREFSCIFLASEKK
jgi:hypothetical protein